MREERKQEFNRDDSVDDAIELSATIKDLIGEAVRHKNQLRGTDNETYENLGEER